jgi:hypothetical protein
MAVEKGAQTEEASVEAVTKMQELSRRHHYLSQFYLRGFADEMKSFGSLTENGTNTGNRDPTLPASRRTSTKSRGRTVRKATK